MPSERRQFRILYRDFLFRMVDLEVLTAHGEIQTLLGQLAAILAAFSFTLAVVCVPRYVKSTLPWQKLLVAAWGDEEFLIGTTIAVVGLFAVIAWNAMLPDRRDCVVLGPLPVRLRTMFLARISAMATALSLSVMAVNAFTGLTFSFLLTRSDGNPLRSFAAYWITMMAAGLFIFCALVAVQGIAAHVLTYRVFLRVSSFLQLAAFFIILGIYFIRPQLTTVRDLTDPANQRLIAWIPSLWFLGLFQQLNGPIHPVFAPLAGQALRNLPIVFLIAMAAYSLAYIRHARRIVEQPDIAPNAKGRGAVQLGSFLAKKVFSKPLDRAILLFTARTIARSRQHRFLLAAYGGVGLAIALAYAKSLVYGYSETPWNRLNQPLLIASLVLLIFSVLGARAIFSLPMALPANWIFRITAVHSPSAYFAAVKRALYTLTVIPIVATAAVVYFSIWSGRPALEHSILLLMVGIVMVETSLYQFRKIPFACSYLPGGANINVKLGIYAILFLLAAELGTQLEFWALQKPARFVVFAAILFTLTMSARARTARYSASPDNRIQFEDLPPGEVFALDLRADGAWLGDQAYVDLINAKAGRPFRERLRPFALGALILASAGFVYEQVNEWFDHKRFPQVGRSVDIGGRSLNIYCSGTGGPTVIFEGTQGAAGYSWTPIQREVAKFTQACWYDRAGYGWSDPGPFPNHSDSIARDLHQLLIAAGVPPPYLLVGDSMGSFHVRVYRGYYPWEVAGMVLVDPLNEDTTLLIHNHIEFFRPAVVETARTLASLGFFRLIAEDPRSAPASFTGNEWLTAVTMGGQAKTIPARISEPPLWVSGELARAAGGFGSLPVMVLSSGRPREDWYTESHDQMLELHDRLAHRSTNGVHMVVNNSRDSIPFEAAEAVVESIRETIMAIPRS
jgi:pimeloyl-ACP methyl ester carboxylesterase